MGVGNGVTAEKIQEKVSKTKPGPVHQGTYRAQSLGNALYGVIPDTFAKHYDIGKSAELEVFVDYDLGCVMVFPAEVIDNGE